MKMDKSYNNRDGKIKKIIVIYWYSNIITNFQRHRKIQTIYIVYPKYLAFVIFVVLFANNFRSSVIQLN